MKPLRVAVLGGLAVLGQLSCGGDDSNPCPTGNCVLPGSTTVKWTFDVYPDRGFGGDTCQDLGVFNVRVVATNVADALLTETLEKSCGEGQATFVGLEPGIYNLQVTPLDIDGNPAVHAPVPGEGAAAGEGQVVTIPVNIPFEAWTATYTGQFLFTISWNGVTCASAVPPITTQRLTLSQNGTPLSGMTDSGQRIDGTDTKPCHEFGAGKFEYVQGLPSGPAELVVVGTDSTGGTHTKTFPTFVGVGISNPTLPFDVADPPPDAGIDAMVDAAPDAPVDAMVDAAPDA